MPSVSILIPCYNAERWVAEAIESALAQSHPDKEVIVVDDGSTDGSLDVIKSFGDRIRWEAGPNRGGNVARNRLLELAGGDWLQYLDADDYLLPDKIQRQLAESADADVIYSPVRVEQWEDDVLLVSETLACDSGKTLIEQWFRWQVAQTGAVLWRTASLRSIGGWDQQLLCCQDNDVTMRAIMRGLTFSFCDEADAVYRIWSEETVCRKDPTRVIETKTKLIDRMLAWLRETGELTDDLSAAAGQACFEMSRTLAKYDMDQAVAYHTDRVRSGYCVATGPAAPSSYRIAYHVLGFRRAELIANWRRR